MTFSLTMPALGESVTEGTVTRWLKNEGDQVAIDEPLLEVSTDKVDTEIPSPVAGVLQKIVVGIDQTVAVGAELAIIADGAAAAGLVREAEVHGPRRPDGERKHRPEDAGRRSDRPAGAGGLPGNAADGRRGRAGRPRAGNPPAYGPGPAACSRSPGACRNAGACRRCARGDGVRRGLRG